jgi:hypothetical protein
MVTATVLANPLIAVAVTLIFCPAAPCSRVMVEGEAVREKSGWSCSVGVDPPPQEARTAARGRIESRGNDWAGDMPEIRERTFNVHLTARSQPVPNSLSTANRLSIEKMDRT